MYVPVYNKIRICFSELWKKGFFVIDLKKLGGSHNTSCDCQEQIAITKFEHLYN